MEMKSENQPRISLPLLRRLFNSISQRKKSPVCSFKPDMRSANAASDSGFNSSTDLMVITIEDLSEIRGRFERVFGQHTSSWGKSDPKDLSDKGYFLTYDVPRLLNALHNVEVRG